MNLRELGHAPVVFRLGEHQATAREVLHYRLPAHSFQGGDHWFLIRLHFRIVFRTVPARARRFVDGATTEVAADANGSTSASIVFTDHVRRNRLLITRDAFGIVSGRSRVVTAALTQNVRFSNFLTYEGVRGGANELALRVNTNVPGLVRAVTIYSDSGLAVQRQGPLGFDVRLSDSKPWIRAGHAMTIRAVAVRTGGAAPTGATFSVTYPSAALLLKGAATIHTRWERSGSPAASFTLVGTRAGTYPVEIDVTAAGGHKAARTIVRVRPAPRRRGPWPWLAAGCIAVSGTAAAFLRRARRRRSDPRGPGR